MPRIVRELLAKDFYQEFYSLAADESSQCKLHIAILDYDWLEENEEKYETVKLNRFLE